MWANEIITPNISSSFNVLFPYHEGRMRYAPTYLLLNRWYDDGWMMCTLPTVVVVCNSTHTISWYIIDKWICWTYWQLVTGWWMVLSVDNAISELNLSVFVNWKKDFQTTRIGRFHGAKRLRNWRHIFWRMYFGVVKGCKLKSIFVILPLRRDAMAWMPLL